MGRKVGASNVKSAGIAASEGSAMSEEAKWVLKDIGINFSSHSKPLSEELVAWADVILALEERHKLTLFRLFPGATSKTQTLGEWAGKPGLDVPDPFGQPKMYRATRDEIAALIEAGIKLNASQFEVKK